jgi:outer membrane protein insertion porin family
MLKRMRVTVVLFFSLFLCSVHSFGQVKITNDPSEEISYAHPQDYELGGVTVSGIDFLDKNVLILISGLTVGEKLTVPGEKIAKAIQQLWDQGLFADINISATKIQGDKIFLNIHLDERPRLSKFSFKGIKKSEADDLRDKLKLAKGQVVTQNLIKNASNTVAKFFVDKGYLNVEVAITELKDSALVNHVVLIIHVDKKQKVKIQDIEFIGSKEFTVAQLQRGMKETKKKRWYGLFKSSKYLEENYQADKKKILEKYNTKGYRDAQIVWDSVYKYDENLVSIKIKIEEGNKYYFRDINWVGNTKYSAKHLSDILGIKSGDIFNQSVLDSRLYMNQNGRDVTSLYMDDGYLFFNVSPIESLVENDSIDFEMRIYEGKQASVNKVTVVGNTKTNDHVIMREIRTKPGQLFSRSDIIRTQRELSQLGYFNAETLGVEPTPNPTDGTVDIQYKVEEKPSDQVELSGGWGAGRVVGTLGVSFNNFSAKNMFKKDAWRPLPAGDGQRLSLRAQSNGLWFQSYNFSFTEPWLGGKKPNSLSVSLYHSIQSNGEKKTVTLNGEKVANTNRQGINITGASLGLGRRLAWPDDYFTMYSEITYQHYDISNWNRFIFSNGDANNLSGKLVFSRNSIDQPIYPRTGSQTTLTLQFTPPYSLFSNKDYSLLPASEKYKWVEYHKWKFTTTWYNKIAGNLVLYTKAGAGFLGNYNNSIGAAPFERFYLGGSGLTGFALDGREIVALRGYNDQGVAPLTGGTYISKYTAEMRYPISLNPSATIYVLGFAEAGNTWAPKIENRSIPWPDPKKYNPFDVKRSAGLGVRIFLPMFGLFGLDYGWGFDEIPGQGKNTGGQFHFTIGTNLGEL